MKLGFLGPKGTFSYEACIKYKKCEYFEYYSICETIEGLKNKEVDEAILPIENSLQGGVTETIDTLIKEDGLYIKKEVILNINQNLLANREYKLEQITDIYSHPQALAQCREFIKKHLRKVEIHAISSTALGAKEVKNNDFCACIASASCVDEFGLKMLKANIQDNDYNETRFWVLGDRPNNSGKKLSIVFSTNDKPGALYRILGIFYKNDVNLSKIESRPAKTVLGEYNFWVDIEKNDNINITLDELKKECKFFKILGSY